MFLTFTEEEGNFSLNEYVFNTEAHPFKKASFDPELVAERLGL